MRFSSPMFAELLAALRSSINLNVRALVHGLRGCAVTTGKHASAAFLKMAFMPEFAASIADECASYVQCVE